MLTGNHKQVRLYQSVKLLIVLIISLSQGLATDYFQFTETDQYELINLGEVLFSGIQLEDGNEIGVFDGELCVGGVIYNGQSGQQLLAWADDPTTPEIDGFIEGSPISFQIYHPSRLHFWRHGELTTERHVETGVVYLRGIKNTRQRN